MKVMYYFIFITLMGSKAFGMRTFNCELTKESCGRVISYVKTTDLGKRIFVQRQEKDGIECFTGYEMDIHDKTSMITLPNDQSTGELWYEMQSDFQELHHSY